MDISGVDYYPMTCRDWYMSGNMNGFVTKNLWTFITKDKTHNHSEPLSESLYWLPTNDKGISGVSLLHSTLKIMEALRKENIF